MTLRKALRASTALTVVSILGMAATVSLSIFDEANAQTWNGAGSGLWYRDKLDAE